MLHTGDFKMDQLPLDDRITDLRAFARLGEEGVDLFLPDSTNADVPGFTAARARHRPGARERHREGDQRRVIVASFSSHVHRVQQVLDAAAANGRQVALVGRSMVRNMGIAADLGYLKVPDGVLVDLKKALELPDDKIVYMSTGSQGEPMAVLARMANHEHQIEVGRGRHRHPGVEPHPRQRERGLPRHQRPHQARRQGRAQGQREGARLRPRGRGRAALLLQHPAARATCCPVHGEYRHLTANAALAIETGVPRDEHDHRRERHRRST